MSSPLEAHLDEAMDRLRAHHARIQQVRAELDAGTVSVRSKDRMVTVVVGLTGEVKSFTFHSTEYQDLAPAKLSAVLVEVLTKAKAEAEAKVRAAISPLQGVGPLINAPKTPDSAGLQDVLEPILKMRERWARPRLEETNEDV